MSVRVKLKRHDASSYKYQGFNMYDALVLVGTNDKRQRQQETANE